MRDIKSNEDINIILLAEFDEFYANMCSAHSIFIEEFEKADLGTDEHTTKDVLKIILQRAFSEGAFARSIIAKKEFEQFKEEKGYD